MIPLTCTLIPSLPWTHASSSPCETVHAPSPSLSPFADHDPARHASQIARFLQRDVSNVCRLTVASWGSHTLSPPSPWLPHGTTMDHTSCIPPLSTDNYYIL